MIDQHTDLFKYVDNFSKTAHIPSISIIESKVDYVPEVTIAIPTYKRTDLLKEAIDSAINQINFTNYDIIVVDNNPERDCDTEKLMKSYNNPIISYYKNLENLGMGGNWNRLFTLAKGKYVVMLHDDDLLEPYYLNTLEQVLVSLKKEPDAVYFKHSSFGNYTSEKSNFKGRLSAINIKPRDFLFGCFVSFIGGCFNKISVLKSGGFKMDYYPSVDYAFLVDLSKYGNCFSITGYPLVKYRISENESMKTETILNFEVMDNQIKTNILSKYPIKYNFFIKSLFKVYGYNNLKRNVLIFNNNDIVLKNKLIDLKNKITLLDRINASLFSLTKIIIMKLRKFIIL